jgi:hypothetical protein
MMPITYLKSDGHSAPRTTTGGPRDDRDETADQEQRMTFIERRLDWLANRVEALEAMVKADRIAPLDPPCDGGGR